ncbi:18873_t:CDS:1 [Dentiscutata erythropus]|uniref:18873_t:CDS:1 n=1 Tax=Dentiscutata erythropus TaxID=1348616 RepID=A0A9N9HNB6_9GLOM|nr:18873_t:CDS:1 [Dentiscutata erythropus]
MSCTGNGLSNGPLSHFANKFFQDYGVASSTSKLIEQGRNTANSFHFSNFERKGQENGRNNYDEELNSWNHFIQRSEDNGNWLTTEFMISEQGVEEEFRQEWSDEKFTEIYIKQRGLDRPHKDKTSLQNNLIHPCENSFVQEFLSISACQDSSSLQFSLEEYSSFMTNDHATTYNTLHNDLLQAQIYLFDHLLSAILKYPMTTTCRPSPEAEWDWARLFSSSRWCSNDKDDNDKISDSEYLQSIALERLQLFLGHIIDSDIEQKNRIS